MSKSKTRVIERDELLKCLREMNDEDYHAAADALLVRYINDPEIEQAYEAIPKWYE